MAAADGSAVEDITNLLRAVEEGDDKARASLWDRVYDELRALALQKMAREQPGQTLQPTALVNEAYLRLTKESVQPFENRAHFFGAAAESMRQILIEQARKKRRVKRGGGLTRVDIDGITCATEDTDEQVLALEEALVQLEAQYPEEATVVKMRYFIGFKQDEFGEALGLSVPTVKRRWAFARAWL
ncbi:MAG: ECF-type sigma factor, partial [Verrucomicrobiota bacterium]